MQDLTEQMCKDEPSKDAAPVDRAGRSTMTKRLIEIDNALLDAAKAALGTSGITDTVVAALKKSVKDEG